MIPLVLTITNVIGAWEAGHLDVILQWEPTAFSFLNHYTLYEARKHKRSTGPWREINRLPPTNTAYIRNIPEDENLSWYVTATNEAGHETPPSNIVDLYEKPPQSIVTNPGRLPT